MAHIGVDLDGVCYSFTEDSRIVVAAHRGVDPLELEAPKVWDFMKVQWGMEYEDYWKVWYEDVNRDHDGGWLRLPPEPGTVEGLTALRDAGHKIHIITYRKGGEINTMKWIARHEIPYDGLHIGRDKTRIHVDLLVDDWEENWKEACAAGNRCLVWDQPWNAHITGCERVYDWGDVLEAVS